MHSKFILFINALQHKCWRSVGLLVLQPVLKMLSKVRLKSWRRRKNSMTGPGQPWTCSHPIYAWTLTEVYQAVRYFSPCYFHVSISRNSREWLIILSIPRRTKWTLVYLLMLKWFDYIKIKQPLKWSLLVTGDLVPIGQYSLTSSANSNTWDDT